MLGYLGFLMKELDPKGYRFKNYQTALQRKSLETPCQGDTLLMTITHILVHRDLKERGRVDGGG
jgi:hypothetical protein